MVTIIMITAAAGIELRRTGEMDRPQGRFFFGASI
jgi:hypothetical protein